MNYPFTLTLPKWSHETTSCIWYPTNLHSTVFIVPLEADERGTPKGGRRANGRRRFPPHGTAVMSMRRPWAHLVLADLIHPTRPPCSASAVLSAAPSLSASLCPSLFAESRSAPLTTTVTILSPPPSLRRPVVRGTSPRQCVGVSHVPFRRVTQVNEDRCVSRSESFEVSVVVARGSED